VDCRNTRAVIVTERACVCLAPPDQLQRCDLGTQVGFAAHVVSTPLVNLGAAVSALVHRADPVCSGTAGVLVHSAAWL
jgi:hypothetical protein